MLERLKVQQQRGTALAARRRPPPLAARWQLAQGPELSAVKAEFAHSECRIVFSTIENGRGGKGAAGGGGLLQACKM